MKFKLDHVTNSSSASYILILESNKDIDIEDFKILFEAYMDDYKHECLIQDENLHFWNPHQISQISKRLFRVEDFTSMYNWASDIHHYIQYMMVKHFVNELKGFKIHSFDVEND